MNPGCIPTSLFLLKPPCFMATNLFHVKIPMVHGQLMSNATIFPRFHLQLGPRGPSPRAARQHPRPRVAAQGRHGPGDGAAHGAGRAEAVEENQVILGKIQGFNGGSFIVNH